MKKLFLFVITMTILFTLSAFDLNAKPSNNPAPPIYYGDEGEIIENWQSYEFALWAGQDNAAGSVIVWNDTETVFVKILSEGLIEEVHIYVYDDEALIPVSRPAPGLAPYGQNDVYDHEVTIVIPMDEINDEDTFYLMVHVAFTAYDDETNEIILDLADETAYAGNDDSVFDGRGAWFYVIGFTAKYIDNDDDDDHPMHSETAWAYGGDYALPLTDFITANRWGWTNGLLSEGSYVFDLYAGAAQNDLSKGTLVGSVSVEYVDGVATVVYSVFNEFLLTEVHLHIGNDVLPMMGSGSYTAAPGAFALINDDISTLIYEFVVEDLEGDIYVAAHAVVYGAYQED